MCEPVAGGNIRLEDVEKAREIIWCKQCMFHRLSLLSILISSLLPFAHPTSSLSIMHITLHVVGLTRHVGGSLNMEHCDEQLAENAQQFGRTQLQRGELCRVQRAMQLQEHSTRLHICLHRHRCPIWPGQRYPIWRTGCPMGHCDVGDAGDVA